MKDADFHYHDWLLNEWARWVKSEFMGSSLSKSKTAGARLLDDETALATDMAIARCEPGTRKLIKRVYLWRDISVSEAVLAVHLRGFSREYSRHAA